MGGSPDETQLWGDEAQTAWCACYWYFPAKMQIRPLEGTAGRSLSGFIPEALGITSKGFSAQEVSFFDNSFQFITHEPE